MREATAVTREHLKVLLVEDNLADARLVTELLRDVAPSSITLTHAGRLRQALGFLKAEGFNLILLDLSLPDSQGIETFAKAHAEARQAPIVVLTGLRDEQVAARAVRDGAQDYLVKGQVDGPLLYQSIRYAIERHRFEETLRASEARYRGLVDGSIQAILIQVGGVVRLANPALSRLLGYDTPEECLGRSIWSFLAPDDREVVAGHMQARQLGLPAPSRYECRAVTRDGSIVWLDCSVTSIPWDGDSAILATMVDISERKRAEEALRLSEEQLRQAQKMEAVGRLAGGVAHDFNNLLTVITSYAELLLRDFGNRDEVIRTDLMEIQNAASTASTLTRQLLAFTRQQVLQPKVLSLNNVVIASENLLKQMIGEDVTVHISLDPGAPHVRADAGQLEQVLINLAVNARDAMPDGGNILIETAIVELDSDYERTLVPAVAGRYAVLTVSDTGVGMAPETQARIFEPFFTTKEFGKGTGLGLATVYGIVKQCGGLVRVQSEPSRGTTFKIYLPILADAADPVVVAPRVDSIAGTETLLLVEDAAAVRSVMRRALERFGYTIVEAPDGQTALALAARYPSDVDLLITDAVRPVLSGRELAARLRDVRPDLRVIYMSGYADDALLRRGDLEPWATYLQKPFTPEALARRVRELLDAR
ncbi:MAG: response regulator [Gemmatimonadaceae bacterium]